MTFRRVKNNKLSGSIRLAAPPEKVWDLITTVAGVFDIVASTAFLPKHGIALPWMRPRRDAVGMIARTIAGKLGG